MTYYAAGSTRRALVWGAKNGSANPNAGPAEKFKLDYSGGYGSVFGSGYWQKISAHDSLLPYQGRGPSVNLAVAGCAMSDGSMWLLQSWMGSELPDNGWAPSGSPDHELWISHWDTSLPTLAGRGQLDLRAALRPPVRPALLQRAERVRRQRDGSWRTDQQLGRLVTVDTLKPPWTGGYKQPGGWFRFNSFLTHKGTGAYCTGVYPHIAGVKDRKVPGRGKQYRVTVKDRGSRRS